MVQDVLPNNLLQNTVIYSVFHPCCFNGSRCLAKQHVPKHRKLQCFPPTLQQWPNPSCQTNCFKTVHVEAMEEPFLPNNLFQSTVKHSVFQLCLSNGASQFVPKACKRQEFPPMWFRLRVLLMLGLAPSHFLHDEGPWAWDQALAG